MELEFRLEVLISASEKQKLLHFLMIADLSQPS